jgi:hypothetical protein
MVNNPKLRKLIPGACRIKRTANGRTKIINGPVYDLNVAKELLKLNGLVVVNENADEDMSSSFTPSMEPDELKALVLALDSSRYEDSERCNTTNGMIVDADGYTIYWNRSKRIGLPASSGPKEYVKFGFRENNPKCLIISIHPADH